MLLSPSLHRFASVMGKAPAPEDPQAMKPLQSAAPLPAFLGPSALPRVSSQSPPEAGLGVSALSESLRGQIVEVADEARKGRPVEMPQISPELALRPASVLLRERPNLLSDGYAARHHARRGYWLPGLGALLQAQGPGAVWFALLALCAVVSAGVPSVAGLVPGLALAGFFSLALAEEGQPTSVQVASFGLGAGLGLLLPLVAGLLGGSLSLVLLQGAGLAVLGAGSWGGKRWLRYPVDGALYGGLLGAGLASVASGAGLGVLYGLAWGGLPGYFVGLAFFTPGGAFSLPRAVIALAILAGGWWLSALLPVGLGAVVVGLALLSLLALVAYQKQLARGE